MIWEFHCEDLREYFEDGKVDVDKLREMISGIVFQGWELLTVSDKVAYFKRPSSEI